MDLPKGRPCLELSLLDAFPGALEKSPVPGVVAQPSGDGAGVAAASRACDRQSATVTSSGSQGGGGVRARWDPWSQGLDYHDWSLSA